MKRHVVTVTEFKAKCLAMLDEISRNGGTITVTKRGRPMAMVSPAPGRLKSSEGMWGGKVRIPPERLTADTSDLWEVLRHKIRDPLPARLRLDGNRPVCCAPRLGTATNLR